MVVHLLQDVPEEPVGGTGVEFHRLGGSFPLRGESRKQIQREDKETAAEQGCAGTAWKREKLLPSLPTTCLWVSAKIKNSEPC